MSNIKFKTMNLDGYGYGSNTYEMPSPNINKLRFDVKTFIMKNKTLLSILGVIAIAGAIYKRKKIVKMVKKL